MSKSNNISCDSLTCHYVINIKYQSIGRCLLYR